jgi:uncharacterized membrane protein required for colicin V production
MLLKHLFSNVTFKDRKLTPHFIEPLEKLAKRVQKRLDAKLNFEHQKGLYNKPKMESDLQNDFMLRG